MNKLIATTLILMCFGVQNSFAQSVDEVDSLLQIAQHTSLQGDYAIAKERLLLLISKEKLTSSDLDSFIEVTRLFRDVTITSELLELKNHVYESHSGESCSCGKHKHCHE